METSLFQRRMIHRHIIDRQTDLDMSDTVHSSPTRCRPHSTMRQFPPADTDSFGTDDLGGNQRVGGRTSWRATTEHIRTHHNHQGTTIGKAAAKTAFSRPRQRPRVDQ